MTSKVSVAFSTDKNYVQPTVVAMASVLVNTKSDIDFYVLSSDLSEDDKNSFLQIKTVRNCNIVFKEINQDDYKKYFPAIDAHYTLPVYYRFLIPQLFPELDKVLYLDGDVIVKDDIAKLFAIDLENYPLAMCEDFNKYTMNARLSMRKDSIYYNAGVILFNCKKWRVEDLASKLFALALKNRDAVTFPIQDVLNPYMEGRILTIDKKWNSQVYQTEENKIIYNFNSQKDATSIIHYIGKIKPWSSNAVRNNFFSEYFTCKNLFVENRHILQKPILLLIFNRPDTTQKVFEQIKIAKPPRLYIASDGARANKPGEREIVAQVRKYVLDNIDWNCNVKTLFREENLGCGVAISQAVTWFFENEKDGIILEDDCVPHQSFFYFCEKLLDHYRYDKRVWHVSGNQFLDNFDNGASYYFAKVQHCWGWASWADRWQHYKFDLQDYDKKNIKNFSSEKQVQKYWLSILKQMKEHKIDTWDYQWAFWIVAHQGLCINPSKNLVSNIGIVGTHFEDVMDSPLLNRPTYAVDHITHPQRVVIDEKATEQIYRQVFVAPRQVFVAPRLIRLFKKILRFFNKWRRGVW